MTPRTIFLLVIKIIALYMIYGLIVFIPQIIAGFPMIWTNGMDITVQAFFSVGVIGIFLVYFFLIRLFLFKPNSVIDMLSLDKHFDQEIISLQINSTAVIQIALIILGGVFFADALPMLFREIVAFLQQKGMDIILTRSPGFGNMVFDACKLTVGYLLFTNSKQISLWIEKKNSTKEDTTVSPENEEK